MSPRLRFVIIVISLSCCVLFVNKAAEDAKARKTSAEQSYEAKISEYNAALLAAKFLAEGNDLEDYASRKEPSIRLCVKAIDGIPDSPEVLRVEHCRPNETEVVFSITYSSWDHRPLLGDATVINAPPFAKMMHAM